MRDNKAVLDFLSAAGLGRSGDLVELVPAESLTKEVERSTRTMVVTISTRARDRAGDVIEPGGVRLERYLKNPVVLWAHDYAQRPLAKSLWVKLRGESIIAKPRFHDSTDLAREVYQLYAEGYLNAWSIGFIPEDWKESGKGFLVTKWDLLEYSAVPVPANPEALTVALKEKRITSPVLCRALGAALPDLVPHDVRAPQVDAPHPALPLPAPPVRQGGPQTPPPSPLRGEERGEGDSPEEIDIEKKSPDGDAKDVRVPASPERPGISADLSKKIARIVREEVRGEIRRLRGSLDPSSAAAGTATEGEPYKKEEGK